ncbi:dimethylsulfonioproprionate lyase family protein [Roseovarius phycicola]|uniref:Dimethylsulfonioproprionate lyase family protein n=1 Tax=Roseovarius phycicola TaxID=3080976 RepID=A0ABZ2HLC1_9RHOB
MRDAWDQLLSEAQAAHDRITALQDFCAFPGAVHRHDCAPHHDPLSDRMQTDAGLFAPDDLLPFRDALCAAASEAKWRETYRDTGYGATLHTHFGCYEVLGSDTPLGAQEMRSFVIYQVPGFHYPMHHHPAEELYLVVAGEGEFHVEGQPSRHLRPGETAFHPSNVPHALTTHDTPIMAYVLWRGDLATKPVWTHPEALS